MEQNLEDGGSNKSSNNFLCRQTSSRWTPTTEQIRILKDLYYNNGVRSPSAEQIQKISARLRQYGKIEGKNVFYWFQNHKARERQKKRLNTEIPMQRANGVWRSEDSFYNKCPSAFGSGAPSSSACSPGMIPAVGQFGKYGYGSMIGEKNFRDYSSSHGGNGVPMVHNFVWPGGVDPHYHPTSAYTFLEKKKCYDDTLYEDQEEEEEAPDLETLPLFPMHGDHEEVSGFCSLKGEGENYHSNGYQYHHPDASMVCSRASLELTLNSYGCMSPFSP